MKGVSLAAALVVLCDPVWIVFGFHHTPFFRSARLKRLSVSTIMPRGARTPDTHNMDGSTDSATMVSHSNSTSTEPLSPNPDDDIFRSIRRRLPKKIQYFLRDSGALRAFADGSVVFVAQQVCREYPLAWSDFRRLSGVGSAAARFQTLCYGDHKSQVIDLIQPANTEGNGELVGFVHGGAWGSGFPAMYRLVAKPFLERGYTVAIVGYRTYPDADADGQVADITNAMNFLKDNLPELKRTTLIGHSSGAHISALAILYQNVSVDRFVGCSGVYNIAEHYRYERSRGVERLSPMAPACGGALTQWRARSPTIIAATNPVSAFRRMPRTLILHGVKDTTSPHTCSRDFSRFLRDGSQSSSTEHRISLKILPHVGHAETVLEVMFGGASRDQIFQWLDNHDHSLRY